MGTTTTTEVTTRIYDALIEVVATFALDTAWRMPRNVEELK